MIADDAPLNPWMGLALGPVLTLACAYGAWVNWQQYSKFPRQPTEVLLSTGARHTSEWVTLGDARFHCDSVFESEWSLVRAVKEHNTYIVITDPAETQTVVGLYPGRADCSAVAAAPAREYSSRSAVRRWPVSPRPGCAFPARAPTLPLYFSAHHVVQVTRSWVHPCSVSGRWLGLGGSLTRCASAWRGRRTRGEHGRARP